jgi:hypothetical protein
VTANYGAAKVEAAHGLGQTTSWSSPSIPPCCSTRPRPCSARADDSPTYPPVPCPRGSGCRCAFGSIWAWSGCFGNLAHTYAMGGWGDLRNVG